MKGRYGIYLDNVKELREQAEKQTKIYENNKRTEIYKRNSQYTNYDEEIINGESVLDCNMENTKRLMRILSFYDEILKQSKELKKKLNGRERKKRRKINEIKKDVIEKMEKILKEQENEIKKQNETIQNLIYIWEMEFKKENKEEKRIVENIQNNFKTFKNKMLKLRIRTWKDYGINDAEKSTIERWCEMKLDFVVFDSDIHNWEKNNSNFISLIWKKRNLLFLIETTDGIKFGGFVSVKINKIDKFIYGENVFAFTFNNNNFRKFEVKPEKKEAPFYVYKDSSEWFFEIGYYDIIMRKKNIRSSVYQDSKSSFDYGWWDKAALIGKKGTMCFSTKRILVIQMR